MKYFLFFFGVVVVFLFIFFFFLSIIKIVMCIGVSSWKIVHERKKEKKNKKIRWREKLSIYIYARRGGGNREAIARKVVVEHITKWKSPSSTTYFLCFFLFYSLSLNCVCVCFLSSPKVYLDVFQCFNSLVFNVFFSHKTAHSFALCRLLKIFAWANKLMYRKLAMCLWFLML